VFSKNNVLLIVCVIPRKYGLPYGRVWNAYFMTLLPPSTIVNVFLTVE
jgi:hypothetical protein